jgi:hypothetical protein
MKDEGGNDEVKAFKSVKHLFHPSSSAALLLRS